MSDTLIETVTLRDLAVIFFRHTRSVAAILLLTLAGTSIYLYGFRKNTYDVTAKILVRPSQAQAPPPSVTESSSPEMNYHFDDVTPEISLFQSHEVVGAVVDRLRLDENVDSTPPNMVGGAMYRLRSIPRSISEGITDVLVWLKLKERLSRREVAIEQLQKSFITVPTKDTNIIDLHVMLNQRRGSAEILNTWIAEYQRFRVSVYKDVGEAAFFAQQTQVAKDRLSGSEESLRQFEDTYHLSEPGREEGTLLEEKAKAEQELADARIASLQVDDSLHAFEREQKHPSPQFLVMASNDRDPLINSILLDMVALRRDRDKLRMTDLDTSERVQNNELQFWNLLSSALAHLRSVSEQRHGEVANRLQVLADMNARLALIQDKSTAQSRLKRNVSVNEGEYMTLEKRYQDALANTKLQSNNTGEVVVVSSAVDPLSPAGPRKTIVLVITLVVGVLASLAWITLAEFFDDRIHTSAMAERILGSPVITVVEAA